MTADAEIRADLAFNDCRYALSELEILLPHFDAARVKALVDAADDLHEAVARFAEKAGGRLPKSPKLEVVE